MLASTAGGTGLTPGQGIKIPHGTGKRGQRKPFSYLLLSSSVSSRRLGRAEPHWCLGNRSGVSQRAQQHGQDYTLCLLAKMKSSTSRLHQSSFTRLLVCHSSVIFPMTFSLPPEQGALPARNPKLSVGQLWLPGHSSKRWFWG